ncbi:MAG: hypothetical protein FJ313_01575 [Gemmatimonadetes bacterium]|nr:hypothetical protein [Gemmatimonadota bacterium]
MRACLAVWTAVGLMGPPLAAWSQTPGVRATVTPERGPGRVLTGKYVLTVEAVKAADARLVSFRLRVPLAYGVDAALRDIRVKAVRAGTQVLSMDLNNPPTAAPADDTPILFAETSTTAADLVVDVVALLKANTTAPKHICDVIFTAQGRPTARAIAFPAGTVAVRNADSALLGSDSSFAGAAVPLFGDLDWNTQVNALDLSLFAEAWRTSDTAGQALPLADLHPYAGGPDPAQMTSTGNRLIDNRDLNALKAAWTEYNRTAAPAAARKGGDE